MMARRARPISAELADELEGIRHALSHEHNAMGVPLRTLAERIGCSAQQVANILGGALPYPKTLVKLRHWCDRHSSAPRKRHAPPPVTGVAFPTFPGLRLPATYGTTLLRSAELEALRWYSRL